MPTTSINTPVPKKGVLKEFVFAAIILVIAFGAGALIYQKAHDANAVPPIQEAETYSADNDAVVNNLKMQSESDDLGSISKDLNATDFSQIDK